MGVIQLFVGYDVRECSGLHVFMQSLMETASVPVAVCPLGQRNVIAPAGSNAFTFARFEIPRLMGHAGGAIFMDGSDMLLRRDIAELEALRDERFAVQVIQHDYKTRHARKYVGTSMECRNEDYPRKQWASVMLINCGHAAWKRFNPSHTLASLQFAGLEDSEIGDLPTAWNWLVDEHGRNNEAALLHFTAGIPAFGAYRNTPHAEEWLRVRDRALMLRRQTNGTH